MESEITVESLPIIGMCNCCLSEGMVKSMITPFGSEENKEIYSEMLLNCFSIDIESLNLGDAKKVICDRCILRLRESLTFRTQVEGSLKILENAAWDNDNLAMKHEPEVFQDDYNDNFCESLTEFEDIPTPLTNICIKNENQLETIKKSKFKKTKIRFRKKNLDQLEIENFLKNGLFPFKKYKKNLFGCPICYCKINNFDDVKKHILDHNLTLIRKAIQKINSSIGFQFFIKNSEFVCKSCSKRIKNYDDLKNHLGCDQKFPDLLSFKLEKDQLDCHICKKRFLNYVRLNNHMNSHFPNFVCENCGKAFLSKSRLRGHIRTHEIGIFPCRYCSQSFDRVTKREAHVSKDHKNSCRYACRRCNIHLPSFYAKQKHMAEIHNEELKKYKCQACPQSYITPGHLSSHVRRDHLNERNHKCDKCDLAFYTKNSLKMHMIKHDGERIFTCQVCQKSYQRLKTLKEHMRIHNNDKRFTCPVCRRAFTQKCTLKSHMRVHEKKPCVDEGLASF